jgi:hypothetical protein
VDIDYGKYGIPDPPVDKRWEEMSEEEREITREYYNTTDFSKLIEAEGEWVLDEEPIYPYQTELDLGVVPISWDENTRYSVIDIRMIYDHELSIPDYHHLMDLVSDAVMEDFPCDLMSGSIKSGTDRELFPEAYDESEESNGTGQEKV